MVDQTPQIKADVTELTSAAYYTASKMVVSSHY